MEETCQEKWQLKSFSQVYKKMKVCVACYITKSGSRWIKIVSEHKKSVHIYGEIDMRSKLTETEI